MGNSLIELEEVFNKNLISVDELIDFDRFILDVCVQHIEGLNNRLKGPPLKVDNPKYNADNILKAIKNIRENDSLRMNYLSMFNSCLVLQVSYFTSTLHDIFKYSFEQICKYNNFSEDFYNKTMNNNEINFQNMYAVYKSFNKYLFININKDSYFNTLVFAQASRHALVHSNSIADEKFIRQISSEVPRLIKKRICIHDKIQFDPSELQLVKNLMIEFVKQIITNIKEKYNFID